MPHKSLQLILRLRSRAFGRLALEAIREWPIIFLAKNEFQNGFEPKNECVLAVRLSVVIG